MFFKISLNNKNPIEINPYFILSLQDVELYLFLLSCLWGLQTLHDKAEKAQTLDSLK